MHRWIDRVIASLHSRLGAETDRALRRQMPFPTKWDPYFTERMSVADIYHYATEHFAFHRQQLTVAGGSEDPPVNAPWDQRSHRWR